MEQELEQRRFTREIETALGVRTRKTQGEIEKGLSNKIFFSFPLRSN